MRRPGSTSLAVCLACLALAGCSSWFSGGEPVLGFLSPYRIGVQQGNVVTKEQLEKLKPGMSRLQVRDVLGTPLLSDAFHADRWDYIFTLSQQGRIVQRREVVLIFDGERLQSIEASDVPTEREFISSIAKWSGSFDAALLELTPEQINALPVPAQPAASAPAEPPPGAPKRNYPPLEPS